MSNQEQFIGRGERIAVKILETNFPDSEIFTQVPICNMVSKEIFEFYDTTYQKATMDIVMEHKNKVYAVRVQDKHHTTEKTSKKDANQRKDMENNNVTVVDIFERESPYLFRNILNYKSVLEVLMPLNTAKVKP